MRAAVHRDGKFSVEDFPLPDLLPGQMRVRPIASGICGTDLSAWQHTDDFLSSLGRFGADHFLFDPSRPLVFGHEFTSEVLEVGSDVTGYASGDVIFTSPVILDGDRFMCLGFSNTYPGGLAEEVIVQGWDTHIKLDPGVDPVLAAMLDPISTGVEGVRRTGAVAGQTALVTGVGPVGLGAVVELASRGVANLVVSDPSERRREIALAYGATHAVDPMNADPLDVCREVMDPQSRLAVVEASGAAGLLTSLLQNVPKYTIVSVMGANAGAEEIYPMGATTANITVTFASGPDFGETSYKALERGHELMGQQTFDPSLMVSSYTGLDGVDAAFHSLRPDRGSIEQVKVLIVPGLDAAELLTPEEYAARA